MHKLSNPPPPPPRATVTVVGRVAKVTAAMAVAPVSASSKKKKTANSMRVTMLHPSFLLFTAEGQSNVRGTDAQVAGVSDRDYLNGLVEASVAKTANQVTRTINRTKWPFEVYEGK